MGMPCAETQTHHDTQCYMADIGEYQVTGEIGELQASAAEPQVPYFDDLT